MHAKKLLFEEPQDELGGERFFDSPYDLARVLVDGKIRDGDPRRLGAYLAQILSYNKRNCPSELQANIVEAVTRRLKKAHPERDMTSAIEDFQRRFEIALQTDSAARGSPQAMSAKELFFELLGEAEQADEQYILAAEPAEENIIESEQALHLNSVLLRRTGLLDFLAKKGDPQPTTRYTFCFPDKTEADKWWHLLIDSIVGHAKRARESLPVNEIVRVLRQLNASGHLNVQTVDLPVWAWPTVVFDPDLPSAKGFVMYYHRMRPGRDAVSVARLDARSLNLWKQYVYRPIRHGVVKAHPVECRLL